jgi:hypothetical protein
MLVIKMCYDDLVSVKYCSFTKSGYKRHDEKKKEEIDRKRPSYYKAILLSNTPKDKYYAKIGFKVTDFQI